MAHTLVRNYVHLVFSTKNRQALIYPPYEQQLYGVIGRICRDMDSPSLAVGGYLDHVHILLRLSQKRPLMKVLQEIKQHSSRWMKGQDPALADFYWQTGYGAFSVDHRYLNEVIYYIRHQEEHHRKQGYKAEFRQLLTENGITFNEEYHWKE